jgi:hypothetical protein
MFGHWIVAARGFGQPKSAQQVYAGTKSHHGQQQAGSSLSLGSITGKFRNLL